MQAFAASYPATTYWACSPILVGPTRTRFSTNPHHLQPFYPSSNQLRPTDRLLRLSAAAIADSTQPVETPKLSTICVLPCFHPPPYAVISAAPCPGGPQQGGVLYCSQSPPSPLATENTPLIEYSSSTEHVTHELIPKANFRQSRGHWLHDTSSPPTSSCCMLRIHMQSGERHVSNQCLESSLFASSFDAR